jgi:acyl carrier protein
MTAAVSEVRAVIVDALREPLADAGVDVQSISADFDLRASGVIDSLGFIQLIAFLEERFACPIDLADVDPTHLTNIGILCNCIAAQIERHDAH